MARSLHMRPVQGGRRYIGCPQANGRRHRLRHRKFRRMAAALSRSADPARWGGRIAEAILHPGGSNAVLIQNLRRNELLQYTTTSFAAISWTCRWRILTTWYSAMRLMTGRSRAPPGDAKGGERPCGVVVFDDVTDRSFCEFILDRFDAESFIMTRERRDYHKLLVISRVCP